MTDDTTATAGPGEEFVPDRDLDMSNLAALVAEATAKFVLVRFPDRTIKIPLLSEWSINALDKLRVEDIRGALATVLTNRDDVEFISALPGSVSAKVMEHVKDASGVLEGEGGSSGNS